MSFRKALDRANEERQQAPPVTQKPTEGSSSLSVKEELVAPPVYFESRHVTLDDKTLSKNRCVALFPDSREGDLYRVVRTQIIQRMQEKKWKTLLVTSALPGEGKSVTSINLAITFAKEIDQTVLLVDGDLRRQDIHKHLGYESKEGLVDYLANDHPLQGLIVWPGIEKLSVISGGRTIQDSTELIGSPKMKSLILEMKSRYKNRYVLIESPPLLSCPDTAAFAPLVDAIVMVVEAERTTTEEVKKALELLPKEKFLGFILNKKNGRMSEYATYY